MELTENIKWQFMTRNPVFEDRLSNDDLLSRIVSLGEEKDGKVLARARCENVAVVSGNEYTATDSLPLIVMDYLVHFFSFSDSPLNFIGIA